MVFAPDMSEIVLEFQNFNLEPDATPPNGAICRYDWLEVWDGFPGVGPHIGRYCGQTSPGRVVALHWNPVHNDQHRQRHRQGGLLR
uniref:CUB domain-containing protein n=1 Tax=Anguilla anguilla TaxID=7936 RepID=A0A0E9TA76_ANGAN